MTKLLAIFAVLSFAFVMSQPNFAVAKKPHPKAQYVCPSCSMVSGKPGTCAGDKTTLVKVGDYYCKSDPSVSSTKPGKCADGTKMIRMRLPKKSTTMHTM